MGRLVSWKFVDGNGFNVAKTQEVKPTIKIIVPWNC